MKSKNEQISAIRKIMGVQKESDMSSTLSHYDAEEKCLAISNFMKRINISISLSFVETVHVS